MTMYIWQHSDWPHFRWDWTELTPLLSRVRLLQGRLIGQAECLPAETSLASQIDALVQSAIQTSAIEGETLNVSAVRSAVARQLGLDNLGEAPETPDTKQLVQMLAEAVSGTDAPLDRQTLCRWQASLFPVRPLFMDAAVVIGGLRVDQPGQPMAVVSRRGRREVVHFIAPPSPSLSDELARFLDWFNSPPSDLDGILRAGIAHLWLVTLHPFNDGNGRISRAIADRALAQDEHCSVRFYSLSAAIMRQRTGYYEALEAAQQGALDITAWLLWFLDVLRDALSRGVERFLRVLAKSRFWATYHDAGLSDRQCMVLDRLWDAAPEDFDHGINASKYQSLTSASKATATRDLSQLLEMGCLVRLPGGGRSTRYCLAVDAVQ